MGQIAAGRNVGSDLVLSGEKIAEDIEEIAVNSQKGTVYTLQACGIVGRIGSQQSSGRLLRGEDTR